MLLELKLRRTGNSVGLVLPKEALAHLGVQEGDAIYLTSMAEGGLYLSAADPDFAFKIKAHKNHPPSHRRVKASRPKAAATTRNTRVRAEADELSKRSTVAVEVLAEDLR